MSDGLIAGKRVLITHSLVQNIMGSTVVTLELAEYLASQNAEVQVFAAFAAEPACAWFQAAGIPVITDGTDLRLQDFDYVWVHSQVLPQSFIEQLTGDLPERLPMFVFHHMSALPLAPDEHPYLYEIEQRLGSLSVFVSEASRDKLLPFYAQEPRTAILANPAPRAYCGLQRSVRPQPRRFLIVSNHRCPELLAAEALLRETGADVVHFGNRHDRYELVSPELLAEFDVVVTIGKTVQYCLTSATPVFVYDHFGGFGYLTDDNLERAAYRNFSGRGGERFTAEQIVAQLRTGYPEAVRFQSEHRAAFVQRYGMDDVFPTVLQQVQPRRIDPFEPSYARVTASAQAFGQRFYRFWGQRNRLESQVHALKADLAERDRVIARLEQRNRSLTQKLAAVLESRSFRLGHAVLRPFMPAWHRIRDR